MTAITQKSSPLTTEAPLKGIRLLSLENRRAPDMIRLIEFFGGTALSTPATKEIPFTQNPEAEAFATRLMKGEIDAVIFTTGIGTQLLLDILSTRLKREEILSVFSKTTVIARGPKTVAVLQSFKIPITLTVSEPSTWTEIIELLDTSERAPTLQGATLAIQEYGSPNEAFISELKKRGASIIQVPLYRQAPPNDQQPLLNALGEVIEGSIHILLVTNSNQVHHFFKIAIEHGLEKQLHVALRKVVIASIGPKTSEILRKWGHPPDWEATNASIEDLVKEVAAESKQLINSKKDPVSNIITLRRETSVPDDSAKRKNSPFLAACRREKTPYTPIWLMRQAGRYMKDYRDIRAKIPFLELCKNKDLAAEITITAAEKLKADAAIIFSDILLIVEPMGLGLEYGKAESPLIYRETNRKLNVDLLHEIDAPNSLRYVLDAIRVTRQHLDSKIPLIGFSGAPFTLASYIIEGGGSKTFRKTKQFMYQDPGAWKALMEKISRGLIEFLNAQVVAGADALQLFDSWVGCLSPNDYAHYVFPYSQAVLKGIRKDVPVIHFGTSTATFLDQMRNAGGTVIGADYRIRLEDAWKIIGYDRAIQGNLDPVCLFSSLDHLRTQVQDILKQADGRPGHIFNLGHGILPETPYDHVVALIDMVHELSQT